MTLTQFLRTSKYTATAVVARGDVREHYTGQTATTPEADAYIYPDYTPEHAQLYALSDYKVASVSGGSVWMLPR